jgi:DNA-directed RNA polymerase subunit omega
LRAVDFKKSIPSPRVASLFVFLSPDRVRKKGVPMARVTVEDCLANVDSRFTLVHLAVRRVLQMRHGAPLTLDNIKANKEVVMALREIAAGSINLDNIRTIEEPLPEAAEAALPVVESERAEIQEILQEATSYDASIEYGASDQYFTEEQPPEDTPEE